jgi:multimeric flavodoxin WrbA
MLEGMQNVRVLGIIGSPRRRGNTETLVEEVLRGAKEAGAEVEKVVLSELDIAPCRACDDCLALGYCTQEDDMAALLDKMENSHVWVLGTPVYWWGPTAQFKAYLDRWYGADKIVRFAGRRCILVVPLGDTDVATARHTVGMLADAIAYTEMELFATVLAPGALDRADVRRDADALGAARRAGREAVLAGRERRDKK